MDIRKYDHVTSLLQELHWLRVPQRNEYKLAVLACRCLHGQAPSYLNDSLRRTADVESRRHLRSAMTNSLVVPTTRCSTISDRSFAAAAPRIWNSLPSRVMSSSSLTTFKRQLKTELFTHCFMQKTFYLWSLLIVQWSGSLETLCHFNNICLYVCMYVCMSPMTSY